VTAEDPGVVRVRVERAGAGADDVLAVEEPLEIRVDGRPLAVTMRTPGDDLDLAAGFLLTEGVIDGIDDLAGLDHCRDPNRADAANVVLAVLAAGARADPARFERARREMYAASSCGLCGKATIDRVFQQAPRLRRRLEPDPALVVDLPERLRAAQPRFASTGGLHGAALFTADGALLCAREDVGRHNAVDKVIGARLRADAPLDQGVLVVSGRAGFEIVQKALMAGIPALVAVGAASSLADRLAREAGLTLCSFVRPTGFNLHRGPAG
jgi:FdhD protein